MIATTAALVFMIGFSLGGYAFSFMWRGTTKVQHELIETQREYIEALESEQGL